MPANTYDTHTDVPLRAIAALVRGAVTNDLGSGALVAMYEDPRTLSELGAHSLPAMCLYVHKRKRQRYSSADLVHVLTLQSDYVLPNASHEKREHRYPALGNVFTSMSDAVVEGRHAAVSDNAEVLALAGIEVDENSFESTEGVAESGHPFFRARFTVTFFPAQLSESDMDRFLAMNASFDLPVADGGDHTPPGVGDDGLAQVDDEIDLSPSWA